MTRPATPRYGWMDLYRRIRSIRIVEQFDDVAYGDVRASDASWYGRELHRTPRIGGRDDRRPRGEYVTNFASTKSIRHRRFGHVVDSRAAATHRAFVHFDQTQSGDTCEQTSRCGAHALRVHEMTWLLIGDAHVEPTDARIGVHRVEHFDHVANTRGEGARAIAPLGIVGKEIGVLLEGASAPRRVDDVHVGTAAFEHFDIAAREFASERNLARRNIEVFERSG